jgi:hypothetical protein
MAVDQDLDQSSEEPKANFAEESKHRRINLILLKSMQPYMLSLCIYVSGVVLKP